MIPLGALESARHYLLPVREASGSSSRAPKGPKSFSAGARILRMDQFSFVCDIFSSSLACGIPAEAGCVVAVSLG